MREEKLTPVKYLSGSSLMCRARAATLAGTSVSVDVMATAPSDSSTKSNWKDV